MDCVIEIKKPEHLEGTELARKDFGIVFGEEITLKPASFLHTETGHYYCHILGGIAYPTATEKGVIIIIGVQNEPTVLFRVLEVYESAIELEGIEGKENVFDLIEMAVSLRMKYGFGKDRRLLPYWYGDQDRYQALIIKTNEMLEKKLGAERGLYIKDLVDLRERYSFPLYIRQLYNARQTGRLEKPTSDVLRAHAQLLQREDTEKGKPEEFPAMGLLGGMVHSLQIERPWVDEVIKGGAFNLD